LCELRKSEAAFLGLFGHFGVILNGLHGQIRYDRWILHHWDPAWSFSLKQGGVMTSTTPSVP
jgi:hypothetical protein